MKVWESVLRWTMVYGLWTAAAAAYTPPEGSPLANHEHPRLFFTDSEIPALRSRILAHYEAEFRQFVQELDARFTLAPASKPQYDMFFDGRNYAFLCAVDPVAMGVGAVYARGEYCNRAVDHALAVPEDCTDSRHDFANFWRKGGCKMTPSLVYDWTYDQVSDSQRQAVADKIVALYDNTGGGLDPGNLDSDKPLISNQRLPLMHGIIFGSVALWGDPFVPAEKGQAMLDHMYEAFIKRVILKSDYLYGPDFGGGVYTDLWGSGNPEGPGYGKSIFGAYLYPIAAVSPALGTNYFEVSPFTKYIPMFLYYKIHPYPVDGRFHYSWHDTGTEKDAAFPNDCATNSDGCDDAIPRVLRMWAYRLKAGDPALASVVSWMVGSSEFRVPLEQYPYAEGVRHYGLFGMFLGGERDVPALTPEQAGLPLFQRVGDWTVFKSTHDLHDSTYLEIDAPIWQYQSGHNGYLPTALQMSKYGPLRDCSKKTWTRWALT